MAATIWDNAVRSSIAERAQRVTAQSMPQWGKFSASGMMAHITDSLRMALGDLPVKSKNLPLRYKPIRHAIIYWLPMPKGAPTAPELIARSSRAVLEVEQREFKALLDRLGGLSPGATMGEHPAFGDLSYEEYGVLIAKHTDHHLRQFGV